MYSGKYLVHLWCDTEEFFWFNPYMQNSALWLTLALPSPDTARITLTTFFAIKASLLFCEEPSAATIILDVKCGTSLLNASLVRLIILCWFCCMYFETFSIYFRKINAEDIVVAKYLINKPLQTTKHQRFTCLSTYNTTINMYSWYTSMIF